MESPQVLIDSLTSHIALYHSHSPPSPTPNPSPRSPVVRWLSSLSTPARQSILTFTDPSFVQILLQMRAHLVSRGPTLFFLLPDLPGPTTTTTTSSSSLPSLCTRRARGLLARRLSSSKNVVLSNGLLLFGSRDEAVLDSVTVSEDLVVDVDRFVGLMDVISNGRFLIGDEMGLGEEWKEMGWLKDRGYYSLEEFAANRLEVVLRRSWGGGPGRKGKGKGKGKGSGAPAAAAGESAFWRKKGCVDWWAGLDPVRRREFCFGFLGKAAKSLTNEIVEGHKTLLRNKSGVLNFEAELPRNYGPIASEKRSIMPLSRSISDSCWDTISCSGTPHYLVKLLNRLLVVQEISGIVLACQLNKVEKETLFFSRLASALTISDFIMRKLRGLIMVVSIDYISRELLGDEKLKRLPNKSEEKKLSMSCRKGKKKPRNPKRINSMPNSSRVNSTLPEPTMRHECKIGCITDSSHNLCRDTNFSVASNLETEIPRKAETVAYILPKDPGKEHAIGLVDCKSSAGADSDGKRNRGKGAKRKISNPKKAVKPENENKEVAVPLIPAESKLDQSVGTSTSLPTLRDFVVKDSHSSASNSCPVSYERCSLNGNRTAADTQIDHSILSADGFFISPSCWATGKLEDGVVKCAKLLPAKGEENVQTMTPCSITHSDANPDRQNDSIISCTSVCNNACLPSPSLEIGSAGIGNKSKIRRSVFITGKASDAVPSRLVHAATSEQNAIMQNGGSELYPHNHVTSMGGTSFEWPSTTPLHLSSFNSPHLPTATDRLHLEVGHKQSNHLHQSFRQSRHQNRNSSVEGGHGQILPSLTLPMSCDWPPVVKNCGRLNQTVTISYDSAFNTPLQASFPSGFAAHAARGMQINGAASENDMKHSGDIFDVYDLKTSECPDDTDSYWLSEEETETHAFSGRDYNQVFGGGLMYWNPAEHVGTGFSRPPSHSSEDSSWAWYEADLNRAIDDMVGMSGLPTSFNTNGMASPPASAFCSPFDPLGPGHQPMSYTVPSNDGGKILHSSSSASDVPEERSSASLNNSPACNEGVKGDSLPYPVLRPIIVPGISRKGSRSEFKVNHDHRSPCLPSSQRDHPRIKRPPSPVVLCVPRVPRPPPPSPVGESRKRGFPIVRSGSSSPRHWGMRSCYNEDGDTDDPRLCLDGAEVVWPSWGTKGVAGTPVAQSIQGSLLQNHLIKISQLACDQEHPDVALPLQPPDLLNCPCKASQFMLHNLLQAEIDFFCKEVAAENLRKKPYINWAVKRVARSLQVLWPRSRTNIFGSNTTGLALPTSDVDLVVSLPPVRNLEPIKEAGILEGRNGIKETCLQHAARYLANQEWVRNDSLKTIENTAIPIIMLVAEVPEDINHSTADSSVSEVQDAQPSNRSAYSAHSDHTLEDASLATCLKMRKDSGSDVKSIRLDISFKSSSHTGLQTSELVRELTQQFPASVPLALVLKKFLADRSLDHSYSGGLSSYCLVLLITRFLQHEHHIGRPINQNLGSLLMDFLYFFGNVFDPRQMRISIQGSGVYMKRERGLSIDPIHIDDPLFPSNNVGRNCFRIHQCIKAFADAYSVLENELSQFSDDCVQCSSRPFELLRKIIPSVDQEE